MPIPLVHARLATIAVVFSAFVGLWGLFLAFRRRELSPSFWGALIVNEIVFVIQGLLGLTMVLQGLAPGRGWVHYLYGGVALLAIPTALAYMRGGRTAREAAVYGAMCLFLAGVSLRAIATGSG